MRKLYFRERDYREGDFKKMNALIYDIEIAKAIQSRGESRLEYVEYCKGWGDHAGMGISCICAYDYVERSYRVFMKDNMAAFKDLLVNRNLIVGFNSIKFDNEVLLYHPETSGVSLSLKSYDLLREIWIGVGLNPDKFSPKTHGGYGLDDVCKINFGMLKSGNGALAPVDFQRGNYGGLVDYCLNDVRMTKSLFDRVLETGQILSPKTGEIITIAQPK